MDSESLEILTKNKYDEWYRSNKNNNDDSSPKIRSRPSHHQQLQVGHHTTSSSRTTGSHNSSKQAASVLDYWALSSPGCGTLLPQHHWFLPRTIVMAQTDTDDDNENLCLCCSDMERTVIAGTTSTTTTSTTTSTTMVATRITQQPQQRQPAPHERPQQQQQQHDDDVHDHVKNTSNSNQGPRIIQHDRKQQQQQQQQHLQHEPLANLVGDVGAVLFAPLDLTHLRSSTTTPTKTTSNRSSNYTTTTNNNNNSMIIKPFSAAAAAYTMSDRTTATTTTAGFTACTIMTMESSSSSAWSWPSERTTTTTTTTTHDLPWTAAATSSPAAPYFYRDWRQSSSAAIMTTSQITIPATEEEEGGEGEEETASAGSERDEEKEEEEEEEEEADDDNDEVEADEKEKPRPAYYPVELQREDASNLLSCPRILTTSMMQQLHDEGLPESLQMNVWERCFAIGRDGDSFLTLLDYCAPYTQTLVCIRTTRGHVLGGFVSHPWKSPEGHGNRHAYYGSSGVSFLFCSHPGQVVTTTSSYGNSSSTDSIPVATTSPGDSTCTSKNKKKELQIYKWTGYNDYCQICNVEEAKLAMGGHGDFGLIVEDNFWHGQTGHCSTYNNPPLIPNNNNSNSNENDNDNSDDLNDGFFEVEAFEIYGLVPYIQSFVPTPTSDKKDLFKKTITDTKGSRWIRTALHGS
jgi:TLD